MNFAMDELRPGGRIMVTQPRRALAKTMSSHLKKLNPEHQYLFGFHYSGHASSSSHKEPILYMTEGITVAILLTWVLRVMQFVKKRLDRDGLHATGADLIKGGTPGSRAGVPSSGTKVGGTPGSRAGVPSSGTNKGGVPGSRAGTSAQDDNPWNPEFQVIVVDECHLRSVHCDVIIALTRWLQRAGVPIVLMLMSATANEGEFLNKLGIDPIRVIRIQGETYPVKRYCLGNSLTNVLGDLLEAEAEEGAPGSRAGVPSAKIMPNLKGALQAVIQIIMQGELWDEPAERRGGAYTGKDILLFLPGTAEISIMATTLELLNKAGYITGVKVYKINARVDQKTISDMNSWPNVNDWKEN
eukprot:1312323-Amphidinium_carterae.1